MEKFRNREFFSLLILGFLQCLTYDLIPTSTSLLTKTDPTGFSVGNYGFLYLPPAIAAALTSWFGGKMAMGKRGVFPLFIIATLANLCAIFLMGEAVVTIFLPAFAYISLFLALFFLGIGYGATYPLAIIRIFELYKDKSEKYLLLFLGVTAIGIVGASPLVELMQNNLGTLLLALGACWVLLFIAIDFLTNISEKRQEERVKVPLKGTSLFFMTQFFIIGIETTFTTALPFYFAGKEVAFNSGNWSHALFWGLMGVTRIALFFFKWPFKQILFRICPLFTMGCLIATYFVETPTLALVLIGLFGLFEGALFPLAIAFAQKRYNNMEGEISGKMLSFGWIGGGLSSLFVIELFNLKFLPAQSFFLFGAFVSLLILICNQLILRRG